METLIFSKSTQTPSVKLKMGLIHIVGRSIPEDPIVFYKPIMDWIDKYLENPDEETVIIINIDLMNTGSSKCILDILVKLNRSFLKKHHMAIRWYYDNDDEDMLQLGEDMRTFIEIPFEFIENAA